MDSSYHKNNNTAKSNDECSNGTTITNTSSNNSSTNRILTDNDTASYIETQPNSSSLQDFDLYIEVKDNHLV